MERIRWTGGLLALAPLALAVLATACSGSSSGPGVVSAGSSTASTPTGSGSASAASGQSAMAKGVAYAACMRAHGEPNFPDPVAGPNGQGAGWMFGPNSNVNPGSPQYQTATKACGPQPSLNSTPAPPLTPAQEQQYLRWAACIRAHGVPSFKDPTFSGGHPQITYTGGDAGQMRAAQQACQQYLRGISGGGTFTG
jgi:hypothetical protein